MVEGMHETECKPVGFDVAADIDFTESVTVDVSDTQCTILA